MSDSNTEFETILVERRGKVGLITLNRPRALNALNLQLMRETVAAAEAFDLDADIAVIVITGSERAFAAGADVKEMSEFDHAHVVDIDLFAHWERLSSIRKPIIAAVSGYALGGGCELAMMCDIIFASESATFGQPEINLGVIPGIGGAQRLTRALGKAKAMDLVLTGRSIDAVEAERTGLVARIFPVPTMLEEVIEIAQVIASKSLPAVLAAKEAVNRSFETNLAEGVRLERRDFHALFALEDQTEGMRAFAEKREPEFKNR